MHPDLELALELADIADEITLRWFGADALAIETKPDLTPVTEADRGVELAIRDHLEGERPGHAVIGEEFGAGATDPDAPWRWVVDPIDGTQNYVRGVPVYATLIALQHDGEGVLGVASAPALGHRWWAARGDGAYRDGAPIRVSAVGDLADAFVSHASLRSWEQIGRGEQFLALLRRCGRPRGFGDFWSHMLVAEGAADVGLDPIVTLWDLAALQVIVEEAGGRFTDLAGRPTPEGGSAVSSNGLLHDAVLAALHEHDVPRSVS